jgi:hypothetical protein
MDTIIMDDRSKQKMGIISYIPLVAFTVCFIYYLFILRPVIAANNLGDHIDLNTQTSLHYDTIFLLLAISGIIAAIVLIYFIIHLARVKHLSSAKKIQWIIVLTAFVPFALPIFWHFEINKEPKVLAIYPDIT